MEEASKGDLILIRRNGEPFLSTGEVVLIGQPQLEAEARGVVEGITIGGKHSCRSCISVSVQERAR